MRHSAGGAPALSPPSLADAAADVVDHSSLAFLLKASLSQRRKEGGGGGEESEDGAGSGGDGGVAEREAEGAEGGVRGAPGPPEPHSLQVNRSRELVEALEAHDACKPSSGSSRRNKKRKKKKLPRGGRAHRRQRQWYFHGWLRWSSACAVSPPFVGRPKLLGIMDGMDQNDSIHCARRRPRQWLVQGSFCVYFAPRAVFLPWFSGPDALSSGPPLGLHHGRYGPEGQLFGEVVVFIPVVAPRLIPMVLSTLVIAQLQFLDKVIDVPGMQVVQVLPVVCPCLLRDRARRRHRQWHVYGCFAGFYLAMSSLPWCAGPDARHHGRYEPEGLFRSLIPAVACARLVLLVILHLALCVPCRQAQDARHRGRYGSPGGAVPVVCNNRCLGLEVQKTAGSPQLQFINKVVYIPVEVPRVFPCSRLLVGPKRSPVAGHDGRCPCSAGCAGSRSSTSLSWRRGLLPWSRLFV